MIRTLVLLIALVGCGRSGFEVHDGHIGIGDDDAAPDACSFGAFNVPHDLAELNSTADEFGPWLSNDKLDIYFSSARTVSNFLIYHAHRATPQATFDPPVLVNNLAASGNVDDPFITDDGLQMVFENSTSTLGKDQELFLATRTDTGVEFQNGAKLANVNVANFSDATASLTSDGLTMIYNSTRAGSSDLYITTRPTTGSAFAAPVSLALNTPGFECCSSLSSDGSSMIMVSDATGTQRISQSLRVGGVYQAPTILDPVLAGATGNGEVDPGITRDGTTIVFVSNRAGGVGGWDVYIAERSCQ